MSPEHFFELERLLHLDEWHPNYAYGLTEGHSWALPENPPDNREGWEINPRINGDDLEEGQVGLFVVYENGYASRTWRRRNDLPLGQPNTAIPALLRLQKIEEAGHRHRCHPGYEYRDSTVIYLPAYSNHLTTPVEDQLKFVMATVNIAGQGWEINTHLTNGGFTLTRKELVVDLYRPTPVEVIDGEG